MNSLIEQQRELLHMTTAIRDQIMALVTDSDLAYRLPGDNISLGELCRQMGETEQSYTDSFKTLTQNFHYGWSDPSLTSSVDSLRTWYKTLDSELEAALNALSEETVQTASVVRQGFGMPIPAQFHSYREALLIFYAKASLYLRALGKPMTEQMTAWIG